MQVLKLPERRVCRVLGQHRLTQRQVPRGRNDEGQLTADHVIDVLTDLVILRCRPKHNPAHK